MRSIVVITLIACFIAFSIVTGKKRSFGPGEQDYGYVTVREGAHMFWWLFHTSANVTDSAERPLIMWLAGGPGGSSCGYGNFGTVGPIDENMKPREDNWVKDYNILFVDCPVGAGFSFVENMKYLANNNEQIAKDLVVLLKGVYDKVPKFKKTPFYIYGISYGGKMAVDAARLIYDEVKLGNMECNIKGVSMGNAWISPIDSSLSYGPFLYQMSLIDEIGEYIINQQANYTKEMYDSGKYYHACLSWFRTMDIIYYLADGIDIYNAITKVPKLTKNYQQHLKDRFIRGKASYNFDDFMNGPVKEALGIPPYVVWGSQAILVLQNLYVDFILPITNTVEILLNNTDIEVHVCNGNLDIIVDTPGALMWINKLKWNNWKNFYDAKRETMWVNNTMEGYKKQGGGLSFYWINVAGHDAVTENRAGTREFLRSVTGI